ncbi:MAG TPA: zf-HC2 domain-containing protein [Propionibacteriaceae bacterium]|nr:zf-HC2 domain-containing protein [Propionibacteriaceae bacterium]
MTAGHDELQVLMGAYVLGGLNDADHAAFAAHLRECPVCQRELAQVSGIPRLLELASAEALAGVPAAEEAVPEPMLTLVRQKRRRSRVLLAVAAAVLAVAMLGAGAALGTTLGRTPAPVAAAKVTASPGTGSQAAVQVSFVKKAWGTELQIDGANLPTTGEMTVWVYDSAGRDTQVASWKAIPSGRVKITTGCSSQLGDIRKVDVVTAAGAVVATAQF